VFNAAEGNFLRDIRHIKYIFIYFFPVVPDRPLFLFKQEENKLLLLIHVAFYPSSSLNVALDCQFLLFIVYTTFTTVPYAAVFVYISYCSDVILWA